MSEISPLKVPALAIAIFYAFGTLAGGVGAPILRLDYRHRLEDRAPRRLLIGAALMILGAIVEAFIGIDAERKSLEHVATPLSFREVQIGMETAPPAPLPILIRHVTVPLLDSR